MGRRTSKRRHHVKLALFYRIEARSLCVKTKFASGLVILADVLYREEFDKQLKRDC